SGYGKTECWWGPMITIGLFSQDQKLTPALSSALGREFEVVTASNAWEAKDLASGDRCDVLILDLNSDFGSADDRLSFYDDICQFAAPVVVMADDTRRRDALDLVERGANSYVRKPFGVRELRTILRKAYD